MRLLNVNDKEEIEKYKSVFNEFIKNGGKVSPMNTESCRAYMQSKINKEVCMEDVLWIFYHR